MRCLGCVALILVEFLGSNPMAYGQSEPSRDRAQARELFRQGLEAAGQERWAEAERFLSRSLELAPVANAYFNLAFVEENLGRIVAASEHYRAFLRLTREDSSRTEIRAQAQSSLEGLLARMAYVEVHATGLVDGDLVELDGEVLSTASLASPIPVDPGSRTFLVQRDGEVIARGTVDVTEGESATLPMDVPPPSAHEDDRPWYRSPWLWSAVAISAAAGITLGFTLPQEAQEPFRGGIPAVEF